MKSKKIISSALSVCLLATTAISVGCGPTETIQDGKTVNVAMANAGYGKAWIMELKEKFEAIYAEEGYKINITTPREDLVNETALSEMRMDYADTGIDLYFTAGVYVPDVLDETFGACVQDLNDVYNEPAIRFDGTEEEVLIKDKAKDIDKYVMSGGNYYNYYWFATPCGLVANSKVLSKYGIEKMPNTTDEMFEIYDAIYFGDASKNLKPSLKSNVYPVVWAGENAYGYTFQSLYTHMAQMLGNEEWEKLFTLDYLLEGDNLATGYTMLDSLDFNEVLEVFAQQFDISYSVPGSQTQRHDMANSKIVTGSAAFMNNGEYFFNEVKSNFSGYLNDVRFIRTPVISALAEKLNLGGASVSAETRDDILSYMIDLIDAGDSLADIQSKTQTQFSITLTAEQVGRVHEARKIQFRSLQADTYIAKDSPVGDIAKLFLRMLASDDAASLMAKYGMGSCYADAELPGNQYQFLKDAHEMIRTAKNFITLIPFPNSVRDRMHHSILFGYDASFVTILNAEVGIAKGPDGSVSADALRARDYQAIAETYMNKIRNTGKTNWSTYLQRIGR